MPWGCLAFCADLDPEQLCHMILSQAPSRPSVTTQSRIRLWGVLMYKLRVETGMCACVCVYLSIRMSECTVCLSICVNVSALYICECMYMHVSDYVSDRVSDM